MAIFTKAILGSAVAGTIALGALVTWDGGTTVNSAKDKITQAGTQIGIFKANETALVNKVTSLKTEKATLTAQVADLEVELAAEKAKNTTDNQRILDLEAEIETLNAQITELETEIETANATLENTAGNTSETVARINALEAELNEANEQAEALQYTLDTTVFAEPDQAAVNEAIDGEVIIPEDGETPPPATTEIAMIGGTPATLMPGIDLQKVANGDGTYELTILSTSGDAHTITIDDVEHTVAANGFLNLGKNTNLDGSILKVENNFNKTTKTFTLVNQ